MSQQHGSLMVQDGQKQGQWCFVSRWRLEMQQQAMQRAGLGWSSRPALRTLRKAARLRAPEWLICYCVHHESKCLNNHPPFPQNKTPGT